MLLLAAASSLPPTLCCPSAATQEALRQASGYSADAPSSTAIPAEAASQDAAFAAAEAARDAAAAAVAAAAAPAWAAHSGVKTLDELPMPSWIVAAPKQKRQTVGLGEALRQVQELASANFDESVELSMCLGIDPRRGDQVGARLWDVCILLVRALCVCLFESCVHLCSWWVGTACAGCWVLVQVRAAWLLAAEPAWQAGLQGRQQQRQQRR